MSDLKYVKHEKINLKNNPKYNEKWLQEKISEDPTILGLGDVILKDKERIQPTAGRLDLLFQSAETNDRYEVEIQLGKTDETHIIRTIEYWDIERKRYPQYDHTAVIIAEDITSRFLNVISLFNGFIPLIAVQINAIAIENNISLICTTVLNQMTLGLVDEEETEEVTDRSWWEQKRGTKTTVSMADKLLEYIKTFDTGFELKYNKFYIGLAKDGQPDNFAIFRPQKSAIRLELRHPKSDEFESKLIEQGLDLMDFNTRSGRYRVRLTKNELSKNEEFLKQILKETYDSTR